MTELRTGLVEAAVKRIEEAAITMERGHISLLPKLGFAVTDINGIQRLSIPDAARLAVDGMLGFLTDNAEAWADTPFVWTRADSSDWQVRNALNLIAVLSDSRDTGEKPC